MNGKGHQQRTARTRVGATAAQAEMTGPDAPATQRLNKAIAASGLCSRRKADELILAGRVSVNGLPEPSPGRQVRPQDVLAVDGSPLAAPQSYAYVLLLKPVRVVCTAHDPEGRPTVLDCLPEALRELRLYPVGRLDYFSEGLLLLTNDGVLAQRLCHPSHHQPKTYEVLVRGAVPPAALEAMRAGHAPGRRGTARPGDGIGCASGQGYVAAHGAAPRAQPTDPPHVPRPGSDYPAFVPRMPRASGLGDCPPCGEL